MIAIAVIGVLSFLIFLISRYARRPQAAGTDGQAADGYAPQWYAFLLAGAVIVIAVVLLFWQFPPGTLPGLAPAEWQTDGRSLTFIIVMGLIAAAGLLVFLLTVFWRQARLNRDLAAAAAATTAAIAEEAPAETAEPTETAPVARYESPSAVRLIGLLGLGLAFLILNWSYVPNAQQYVLISNLIYPAGLIVALVMLFDKASRTWNVKTPGESLREWLFCDALVFLYVIGYLNLLQSGGGDTYAALFWDFIHVTAFLLLFWIIDRKLTRLRFLIAYAYLIALPILLLIWRTVQGVEVPAAISWWSTIWPFFGLAVVFFVLEVISLIITRESQSQGIPLAKDVLFLIIYGILLIAAIPEAAA